jgi:hypothetical protein
MRYSWKAAFGISIESLRDNSRIVANPETVLAIARCARHYSDSLRVRRDPPKISDLP